MMIFDKNISKKTNFFFENNFSKFQKKSKEKSKYFRQNTQLRWKFWIFFLFPISTQFAGGFLRSEREPNT